MEIQLEKKKKLSHLEEQKDIWLLKREEKKRVFSKQQACFFLMH